MWNNELINVMSCSRWVVIHVDEEGHQTYFLQPLNYWDNIIKFLTGKTIFEWFQIWKSKKIKVNLDEYMAMDMQKLLSGKFQEFKNLFGM